MDTKKKPLTSLEKRRMAIQRNRDRMITNKAEVSAQYRNKLVTPSRASPEEAAIQLDSRCPYCNALLIPRIETYEMPLRPDGHIMYIWPDLHGCVEEAQALQIQAVGEAAQAAEDEAIKAQKTLDRAGLIGWLGSATFDSYTTRDDWPPSHECWQRVWNYTNSLLKGELIKPWLILYGNYGLGKSHLAAAVIREAIGSGWPACYFRVWPEYLKRLQASWDSRRDEAAESEADIIDELQTGQVVVIDDLDKRGPTKWSREVLYNVLNHRYNAQLSTILTFNYGPTDIDPQALGRLALEEYLGAAILDRLIQSAFDVVEFNGPSYRSGVNW